MSSFLSFVTLQDKTDMKNQFTKIQGYVVSNKDIIALKLVSFLKTFQKLNSGLAFPKFSVFGGTLTNKIK